MSNSTNFFVHTLPRARKWQGRAEFDQVSGWWRDGGRGVCALTGMGGAGKSAIAERFLNVLPGVIPSVAGQSESIELDHTLQQPESVFVYSFYANDKPESFFEDLALWTQASNSSASSLLFALQNHAGLLILDGLEMVQEGSASRGLGALISLQLRELLVQIGSGVARRLSVLVTSRYPLIDLKDSACRFFLPVRIDTISVDAGIQLLRDHGVHGTHARLGAIVADCGQHALTVDLAGGYIKEYRDGDASAPFSLAAADELQKAVDEELDDEKRLVLMQGSRFFRLAEQYREAMIKSDEAALSLLEKICLFRLGVTSDLLVKIFTGPGAVSVSGNALAALDAVQLQQRLDWLSRIGILEASTRSPQSLYSVHPAIKDSFSLGISKQVLQTGHNAARRGLTAMLGGAPGSSPPTDGPSLDLLEEILHHTLECGFIQQAWDIYRGRMGGCHNLIASLNQFARVRRITLQILRASDDSPSRIGKRDRVVLCNDLGYSSLMLGNLDFALEVLARGFQLSKETRSNFKTLGSNLAHAQFLAGNLRASSETLRDTLLFETDPLDCVDILVAMSEVNGYRGDNRSLPCYDDLAGRISLIQLEEAQKKHDEVGSNPFWDRSDDLQKLADELVKMRARFPEGHDNLAAVILVYIQALLDTHNDVIPEVDLETAWDWAIDHGVCEVVCAICLIQTRIRLREAVACCGRGLVETSKAVQNADRAIERGLQIARQCGFGLLHIDLLLERARLRLLSGDPNAATEDITVALSTGISFGDGTSRLELVAATDDKCGYAWAIPYGHQLQAEAILLQTAQEHQSSLLSNETTNNSTIVQQAISRGRSFLLQSLEGWHGLCLPGTTGRRNISVDGKSYNWRAEPAFETLRRLDSGVLTRYPLKAIFKCDVQPRIARTPLETAMAIARPTVFISYSHDSDRHVEKVLGLATNLTADGCDCRVDVYKNSDDDWPTWMTREVLEADFVLCVISETYYRRFRDDEQPDVGLGVAWEASLIRKSLYKKKLRNKRIVPIFFDATDKPHIPEELVGFDQFNLVEEAGYRKLLHKIHGVRQHAVPTPGPAPALETTPAKPLFERFPAEHHGQGQVNSGSPQPDQTHGNAAVGQEKSDEIENTKNHGRQTDAQRGIAPSKAKPIQWITYITLAIFILWAGMKQFNSPGNPVPVRKTVEVSFDELDDDWPIGSNTESKDKIVFQSLDPGGGLFVNHSRSIRALQFRDAGLRIELPSTSERVEIKLAEFAQPITVRAFGDDGMVLDEKIVDRQNNTEVIVFRESNPPIVKIELTGGSGEGGIVLFRADILQSTSVPDSAADDSTKQAWRDSPPLTNDTPPKSVRFQSQPNGKDFSGEKVCWAATVTKLSPISETATMDFHVDDVLIRAEFIDFETLRQAKRLKVGETIKLQGELAPPDGRTFGQRLLNCRFWTPPPI